MYPSDLTDKPWELVESLMPAKHKSGRPRKWGARQMFNAILYVSKTGCQWRQLPGDFPPWKSVYNTYWRWREKGLWQSLNAALHTHLRVKAGRNATPSAAIIDSQSVKTVSKGGSAVMTQARKSRDASAT